MDFRGLLYLKLEVITTTFGANSFDLVDNKLGIYIFSNSLDEIWELPQALWFMP